MEKITKNKILISILGIVVLIIGVFLGRMLSYSQNNTTNDEKIMYSKTEYSCNAGQKIETEIILSNENKSTVIQSFKTGDDLVAGISELSGSSKVKKVQISCNKPGDTILMAETNTGVKTTAKLTVKAIKEEISFEKSSYICEEGETITTYVNGVGFDSFTSGDSSIATITKSNTQDLKCPCVKVMIQCKKKGTVELTATSSLGNLAKATITVNSKPQNTKPQNETTNSATNSNANNQTENPKEKEKNKTNNISFEKSSYTCKEKETIITYVNGVSFDGFISSDPSIASITKSRTQDLKCPCTKIEIICQKEGNVTLTAKSGNLQNMATLRVNK